MKNKKSFLLLVLLYSLIIYGRFGTSINPHDTPYLDILAPNPQIQATTTNFDRVVYVNFIGCYTIGIPQTNLNQTQWYIHIPVISDYQCPIFLKNVWSTPVNIIKDYRINSQDFSGENFLLEVNFTQFPESGTYKIYWEVSVFLKYNSSVTPLSWVGKTNVSDLPSIVKPWLSSTEFIQSNHSEIQSKANSLAGSETNVIAIIENVIDYTFTDIEYGVDPINYSQDALNSLHMGKAVCTGKVNLATALLRACNIPTRVHMIYPTHFIAECYLHPYGWVRIDPSMGTFVYQPFMIPTNTFESFYLYINAYSAHPVDEYSTHEINGFAPVSGVISYWSPTEEQINFTIDIFNDWEITCTEFGKSSNSINKAFNITTEVWKALILYNENDTLSEFKNQFPSATNLYNEANLEISKGNLNEYVKLMSQILCMISGCEDQNSPSIIFDISFLFILVGFIIPIIYLRIRGKITNHSFGIVSEQDTPT